MNITNDNERRYLRLNLMNTLTNLNFNKEALQLYSNKELSEIISFYCDVTRSFPIPMITSKQHTLQDIILTLGSKYRLDVRTFADIRYDDDMMKFTMYQDFEERSYSVNVEPYLDENPDENSLLEPNALEIIVVLERLYSHERVSSKIGSILKSIRKYRWDVDLEYYNDDIKKIFDKITDLRALCCQVYFTANIIVDKSLQVKVYINLIEGMTEVIVNPVVKGSVKISQKLSVNIKDKKV